MESAIASHDGRSAVPLRGDAAVWRRPLGTVLASSQGLPTRPQGAFRHRPPTRPFDARRPAHDAPAMRQRSRWALLLALALTLAPMTALAQPEPDQRIPATVWAIADGDSILVRFGGGDVAPVRLIGIDAPEIKHPSKPVQCFGEEAAARLDDLAMAKEAWLEFDVQRRDRYGRLLAYVWLDESPVMLNTQLVAEGYAQPLTIPPNVRYADELRLAAATARDRQLGLWSACQDVPEPATDYEPTTDDDPAAPAGPMLTVRGTGSSGLVVRRTPGGDRVASANEGEQVVDLGERQQVARREWRRVRAPDGVEGWAAAEFLIPTPPGPRAPALMLLDNEPDPTLLLRPESYWVSSTVETRGSLLSGRASTPNLGQPLAFHVGAVWSVAFSPDGTILASVSADQSLRLWDAATGQPLGQPVIGHTAPVRSVAFSPDGTTPAPGRGDRPSGCGTGALDPGERRPADEPIGISARNSGVDTWRPAIPQDLPGPVLRT